MKIVINYQIMAQVGCKAPNHLNRDADQGLHIYNSLNAVMQRHLKTKWEYLYTVLYPNSLYFGSEM